MKKIKHLSLALLIFAMMISFAITEANPKTQQARPTIKVGALGPLAITPGHDMKQGALLAVDEINSGAGVDVGGTAHDIDLIVRTTSGSDLIPDPNIAGFSLSQLIDSDNVSVILGGFRTEVVVGLQATLGAMPFLGVGSTAPIITPYYWRTGPTNGSRLAHALIDLYMFHLSQKGAANITVFREDAAWSAAVSLGAKSVLMNNAVKNFTFSADVKVPTDALPSNVESSMAGIPSNTNAILTLFSGPVGAHIAPAWAALNSTSFLAGINVEAQKSSYFANTNGAAYGEIEIESAPPDLDATSKSAAFKTAYKAMWGEDPTYTATASYDAVYIIKGAIERAGASDSASIQAELVNTNYTGAAWQYQFTSELGPQLGANDTGYPTPISPALDPSVNNFTVHDLFTPSTVGVRGKPFAVPSFAQWQQDGVKKTVWGFADCVGAPFTPTCSNPENHTLTIWPINHAEAYSPTSPTGPSTVTKTDVNTETTSITTSIDVEPTGAPGFEIIVGVLSIGSLAILSKRRRKK